MHLVSACSIVLVSLAAACSSGGSGETSGGPCESAGKRICERACACGTGTSCKTGFQTRFEWSDRADCEGNYAVSRCSNGGPAGVDLAACESAVNAASCTDDVLVVPTVCEPARDGG